ncbi:MAG: hypothetical protein ILM98_10020 [Kiritimatiellae bacterium]|nr:hypothetical protein [Kiritimatiellia bacterium]
MTEGKAKVVTGGKVVELTRYLMSRDGTSPDAAYRKLCGMKLFELLSDSDTRLFLESDEYLREACAAELDQGLDALYDFIKPEV